MATKIIHICDECKKEIDKWYYVDFCVAFPTKQMDLHDRKFFHACSKPCLLSLLTTKLEYLPEGDA